MLQQIQEEQQQDLREDQPQDLQEATWTPMLELEQPPPPPLLPSASIRTTPHSYGAILQLPDQPKGLLPPDSLEGLPLFEHREIIDNFFLPPLLP